MANHPAQSAPFGSILAGPMAVAEYHDGAWGAFEVRPVAPLPLSPAAHVLHYGSTCFEGGKAFLHADGSVNVFRLDKHIARMIQSARSLVLPEPNPEQLRAMVLAAIEHNRQEVPEAPGALYLRPMLIGTTPNILSKPATRNILVCSIGASSGWRLAPSRNLPPSRAKPMAVPRAPRPISRPAAMTVMPITSATWTTFSIAMVYSVESVVWKRKQ